MVDTWHQSHCPECKASNFICVGDMTDCTAFDPIGIQCWKCGTKWLLDDDIDEDESLDADYETGVNLVEEKPKKRRKS